MAVIGIGCITGRHDADPVGVTFHDSALSDQFLLDLKMVCGIDFGSSEMPRIAVLDAPKIEALVTQTEFFEDEYRLWRALGFIDLSRQQFTEQRMREVRSLKAFYEPKSNLVWIREGETPVALRLVLAHELTHAWRILEGVVDDHASWDEWWSPESAIAFRAGEEGIAIACASAYFAQLSESEQWAWHEEQSDYGSDEVDPYGDTEPFYARAHGWVNVLGPEFIESRSQSLPVLARSSTLVKSTAELLGKSATVAQTRVDLGPLALREALVWSGVSWQNAEAIAMGVVEDELQWRSQQGNSECLRVAIRYTEPDLATGRFLTAREALERWSRFLGAEVQESRDGFFVMDSCIAE